MGILHKICNIIIENLNNNLRHEKIVERDNGDQVTIVVIGSDEKDPESGLFNKFYFAYTVSDDGKRSYYYSNDKSSDRRLGILSVVDPNEIKIAGLEFDKKYQY